MTTSSRDPGETGRDGYELRADPADAPRRRARSKSGGQGGRSGRGGRGGGNGWSVRGLMPRLGGLFGRRAGGRTPGAAPRGGRAPAAGRRRRSLGWWLFGWAATLAVWGLIAVLGVVAYYASDLPDVDSAASLTRRPAVTLLAADGAAIAAFGDIYGDPIRLRDIPPHMPQALMAIEDRRFYSHFGVDPLGILRAVVTNLRAGRVAQGGSTITQQVAKNLFLTADRNFKRKVQEVLLSLWLEHKFSKDQILSIYLNRVYLGAGTFGVEAAARRYFGIPAAKLTLYQAAMLAGLPKAPSRYNPARDPEAADRRARQVIAAMVEAGFITEAKAKAVEATAGAALAGAMVPTGRYFADWVAGQLPDFLGGSIDRDLTVVTTLDRSLQIGAEDALETLLTTASTKDKASQGAVVVMSPDGAIRALVGGRDYGGSQFNRATQALRQPGSAFKPFVYLAGLESGISADAVIPDAPITIGKWQPKNFSGKYEGPVTLGHAVAHSINTVAVRVSEQAGRRKVADVATRAGLTMPKKPDSSIALGTSEVSPLDLTAAYATLASGGLRAAPYAIQEIRDRDGRVLYRRPAPGRQRVFAAAHVADLVRLMTGVIRVGTGRKAALDRPAAAKTGTTQDFRDAWFMGFTGDMVGGVWLGNDDNTSMKKVTGGSLPAELWREVMVLAHGNLPPRPLFGTEGLPPPPPETLPVAGIGGGAGEPDAVAPGVLEDGLLDGLINQLFGG